MYAATVVDALTAKFAKLSLKYNLSFLLVLPQRKTINLFFT